MELRKALSDFEFKADAGTFRATISTYNVIDSDLDVTFPGAFPVGKSLVIGGYNHSSMPPISALPTGKGVIGADETRAWVDGQFFMDTSHGKAMYETVKALGPVAEWSYVAKPLKIVPIGELRKSYPTALRGFLAIDPFEASAVIKGAGIGTRTDFIKSDASLDEKVLALLVDLDEVTIHKVGRKLSAATRARVAAVIAEMQKLLDENDLPDVPEVKSMSMARARGGLLKLQTAVAQSRGGYI